MDRSCNVHARIFQSSSYCAPGGGGGGGGEHLLALGGLVQSAWTHYSVLPPGQQLLVQLRPPASGS